MGLKAVLESLDDVPEALHESYKEVDGKFVLDLEGVDDHPAVANLRNAYQAEKEKRKKHGQELQEAQRRLADLPEDFDPDEWSRLRAEAEAREKDPDNKDIRAQIEQATAAVRKDYETRMANLQKKYEGTVEELQTGMQKERELNFRQLKDVALTSALTKAGVKPALLDAAKLLHERNLEVVEDDEGERKVQMRAELGGESVEAYFSNWAQSDIGKEFVVQPRGADAQGSDGRHRQPRKAGDLGGSRDDRLKAIKSRFPDLKE